MHEGARETHDPVAARIAAALIAGSPDGILAFDREYRCTLWNAAMERITGFPARDVLGRTVQEVFPFLVETGEIDHFRAALGGEARVVRQQRLRMPAGNWGFFDVHFLPLRDGEAMQGMALVRNVTGRRRNEMRANAQVMVSRVLVGAEAGNAGALILAAIGEATEWECGAYWEVDAGSDQLACDVTWRADEGSFDAYLAASRTARFARGEGLPGECWARTSAVWVADIQRHPRYATSKMATREGLRSAVAFPILVGGKAIGVMEFFRRRPFERDDDLVQLLEDLGAEFGQFIERKRVEASEAASRAHLARAQSAARLGMWDWDLSTDKVQWSEGVYALLGIPVGSVAPSARRWHGCILPEDLAWAEAELPAIIERGGDFTQEFRIRRADGAVRWVASIGRVERVDGKVRLLGVNIDITDRKEAEIMQRRQLEELTTLLDTLPVGVLIAHDPQCRRVTGNRVANRLMRSEPEGNISKTPEDGGKVPGYRAFRDGRELALEELPLRRALSASPVENLDYQLRFEDGTCVDLLVSAAPLYDEAGAIRGAVATLLDVTEQKRARMALQEEDRRKSEFIATLAHELRNPLAPIRNALDLLRRKEVPAPLQPIHAMIERQSRHLVRLVDDLLDVSRISRGRLELRRERVLLDTVVAQALEAVRPTLDREGHALEVSLPAQPVALMADAVRLVQALVNVLANAVKYTPRGGRIALQAQVVDLEVVIRVRDNGIGMSEEQVARMFDMFWQAGDAVTRSQGGLGIGLSLGRTVVEMHGGRLAGRSEGLGRGSEFELRLPLA